MDINYPFGVIDPEFGHDFEKIFDDVCDWAARQSKNPFKKNITAVAGEYKKPFKYGKKIQSKYKRNRNG